VLDIKFIRENPDIVKNAIKDRGMSADVDLAIKLDSERRALIVEVEQLKNKKNVVSGEIAKLLKEKQDAGNLIADMKVNSQKIGEIDKKVRKLIKN